MSLKDVASRRLIEYPHVGWEREKRRRNWEERERGEVERENRHVSRKYHFKILDGQNVKFGESNQVVTF